jgi:hypothetical protein
MLSKTIDQWQKRLDLEQDDELLVLESKCIAQQAELSKVLQDLMPQLSMKNEEVFSSTLSETYRPTTSPASSTSSSSSGSTITVRRRYLNSIGRINLLRDRMFNLEGRLQSQIRERELERKHGRDLALSDATFYDKFHRMRLDIVNEYWMTKKEMSAAYQSCLEEGIQVLPANLPPFIDQLFREDENLLSWPDKKENSHELPETSENIRKWVAHVQRSSQQDSIRFVDLAITDRELGEVLPLPQYQMLSQYQNSRASTDPTGQTAYVSNSESSLLSFQGEIPMAGRRYSAPMLMQNTDRTEHTRALTYQNITTRKANWRRRETALKLRRASSDV